METVQSPVEQPQVIANQPQEPSAQTQTQAQSANQAEAQQPAPEQTMTFKASDNLASWLKEFNVSLVFSSYQTGRIFFVGRDKPAGIHLMQRNFVRCMGMAMGENIIYLSSLCQIWKFVNCLLPTEAFRDYDKLYVPQVSYSTGDIDIHDMAIDHAGDLVFINTLFSCLCVLRENYSFEVIWKPPFISRIAPEDRCHLNGLAMQDKRPKYVTMFSQTNTYEGWRAFKEKSGMVMDIQTNEIICRGLSMPHSPRLYKGNLWLLNSGTGYLGYVDLKQGNFVEVAFCPGYARGLDFVGDYAIVGLSHLRDNNFMAVQSLRDNLQKHDMPITTGILIIDTRDGKPAHWFEVGGAIQETYDVYALPDTVKPMVLGIMDNALRRAIVTPLPGEKTAGELMILDHLREQERPDSL
jgi:uncharacterized protein (TIGR03032 family)